MKREIRSVTLSLWSRAESAETEISYLQSRLANAAALIGTGELADREIAELDEAWSACELSQERVTTAKRALRSYVEFAARGDASSARRAYVQFARALSEAERALEIWNVRFLDSPVGEGDLAVDFVEIVLDPKLD